jgi:hypothetical protein
MSYDVSIACPACEHDMFWRNYTSNVVGMWDLAMPKLHLRDMDGRPVAECLPHLREGVAWMESNREACLKHEPGNGWGDYDGALAFLAAVLDACVNAPAGSAVKVSA